MGEEREVRIPPGSSSVALIRVHAREMSSIGECAMYRDITWPCVWNDVDRTTLHQNTTDSRTRDGDMFCLDHTVVYVYCGL